MVGKKTGGVKGMQSTQSPPEGNKAGNDVFNTVKNLQAREEPEREESESQKRKARDTDSELDTSGELTPLRKMTDQEKVQAAEISRPILRTRWKKQWTG